MTRWQSIATILKVVTAMFSILICAQPVCLYARMQNAAAHRNNWGVVVSTSMYWYNYRHTTNALVFYHTLKRLGVPDSNILLLLAEDHACNPHNAEQAALYTTPSLSHSVYGVASFISFHVYLYLMFLFYLNLLFFNYLYLQLFQILVPIIPVITFNLLYLFPFCIVGTHLSVSLYFFSSDFH